MGHGGADALPLPRFDRPDPILGGCPEGQRHPLGTCPSDPRHPSPITLSKAQPCWCWRSLPTPASPISPGVPRCWPVIGTCRINSPTSATVGVLEWHDRARLPDRPADRRVWRRLPCLIPLFAVGVFLAFTPPRRNVWFIGSGPAAQVGASRRFSTAWAQV